MASLLLRRLFVSDATTATTKRTWSRQARRPGALGFKLGMMSHYDKWGRRVPVTVIRHGTSTIMEVGAGFKRPGQLPNCQQSFYEKLHISPKLATQGFPISADAHMPPGTPIYAAHFVPGQLVDVQSRSKGKGFQGAMVRWGFKGLPASHGVSVAHRHLGATGCRTDPGRVLKGKKMAGRMGGGNVTHKCLQIIKIDNALNCIFVRGCVGGHENTIVRVWDSIKNPIFDSNPPPFPTFFPGPDKILPRIMAAPEPEIDTLKIKSPQTAIIRLIVIIIIATIQPVTHEIKFIFYGNLVRDKARNGFYATVLGGTLCIFGGVGYLLARELLGEGASYSLIEEAVALIEQDPKLQNQLGIPPPLAVFGTSDGRRRRPAINRKVAQDGRQLVEAQFYVQGKQAKGKVYLRATEREDGEWEKQILTVEISGRPPYHLIKSILSAIPSSSRWNPFRRLFKSEGDF